MTPPLTHYIIEPVVKFEEDANALSETGSQTQSDQGEVLIDGDGASLQIDKLTLSPAQPQDPNSKDSTEAVNGEGGVDRNEVEKQQDNGVNDDVEQQNSTNV